MKKITDEQMKILRDLISTHNTIRYGILQKEVHQTVENHTNRMLALAHVIAASEGLHFDKNELNGFILLHDLPELGMKQDITTWLIDLFNAYEEQKTELTRFVKWLDKYEASLHMIEIDFYSEIPLINFSINTDRLIKATIKFPRLKQLTLKYMDNELRPIWERSNQMNDFVELRNMLEE
ncbi:MAG: hypothetical protein FWE16_00980 [Firmicutes bacterium]|nr:hypothetical protein [Bacillota bacterium]